MDCLRCGQIFLFEEDGTCGDVPPLCESCLQEISPEPEHEVVMMMVQDFAYWLDFLDWCQFVEESVKPPVWEFPPSSPSQANGGG